VSKPDDLEVNDHTDWWVAFHAEGDEPWPIAFARTEDEPHAAVIAQFLSDEPDDGEDGAKQRASNDIVHARCALRVAWRNDFERDRDEPRVEWLEGDEPVQS